MHEYKIGKRLVEGYLHQPYSWFLNRHSSDLGKVILSEVQVVINSGMVPLITLLAQSTVTLALLFLLLIVEPLISLSIGLVLGLSYASIYAVFK